MRIVAGCAVAAVIVAFFGAAVFTSSTVSTSRLELRSPAAATPNATSEMPLRQSQAKGQAGSIDLYGNEVDDAVATYSLDPAGGLYEVHSPQTELPRLGSPKS